MRKTFWLSACLSLTLGAWLVAEDPSVVVRLMNEGRPETVLVAGGSGRVESGLLKLEGPFLYLINPDGPTRSGEQEIQNLESYARQHPEEVAVWAAREADIELADGAETSNWGLDQMRRLEFVGDARLEFGWGPGRNTFHAERIRLVKGRLEVPGHLRWTSARWRIESAGARALLRDPAVLQEQGPTPQALFRGLDGLELKGPCHIEAEPREGAEWITIDATQGAEAQVTGDIAYIRLTGTTHFRQGTLVGTMKEARGILGPKGWEWFEAEDPEFVQIDEEGREMRMQGARLVMTPGRMVIEGQPVMLTGATWECRTLRVERDLVTGRLRFKDPHIHPRQTESEETP